MEGNKKQSSQAKAPQVKELKKEEINLANVPALEFAIRGKDGVTIYQGPPDVKATNITTTENAAMEFSPDGSLFAVAASDKIVIYDVASQKSIQTLDREKVSALSFSPLNNYVVSWERPKQYTDAEQKTKIYPNLFVWDIKSGKTVAELTQKYFFPEFWPTMQWSVDETFCVRVVKDALLCFEKDFKESKKLDVDVISRAAISPIAPYHIATFSPEKSGKPGYAKIFEYPSLKLVSSKTFFKCNEANLIWSPSGKAVLIFTRTDVDDSKKSYYGQTALYFLASSATAEPVNIVLKKEGAIHDVTWNPAGNLFAVVYGHPANTTIFEVKSAQEIVPLVDLGTAPRNFVRFSPNGYLLLVAGFENLPGNVDIWDFKKLKKVGSFVAECAVHCEWSRDSRYILTAVLSPRIRIDNCFTLWSYDGSKVHEEKFGELWQVKWEPKPVASFPNRPPSPRVYKQYRETQKAASETEATKKYVPPHLRHLQQAAPVGLKKGEEKPMKYAPVAKPVEKVEKDPLQPELSRKQKKKLNKEKEEEKIKEETPVVVATSVNTVKEVLSEDERQKRIKALKKKHRQIEDLKQLKASGKTLLEEQEKKLGAEQEILDQIKALEK